MRFFLMAFMLGASLLGCGAAPGAKVVLQTTPTVSPAGRILLISGRDDHGLLANAFVPLRRAPTDATPIAAVRDGSFVRVLEQQHEWFRVQALTAEQTTGWVNDFYLRNRALRTDGGGQVEFVGAEMRNGQVFVAVRPVGSETTAPTWMAATALREVGAK